MSCKRPANIIVYTITLHHIHNSVPNRCIFGLLFDTRWSCITIDLGRTTLSIDLTVVIAHVDHSCSALRWIESIYHGWNLLSTNERPLKRADEFAFAILAAAIDCTQCHVPNDVAIAV